MKMNYYWFNRQEILQKAKKNYSKEKAAEYYQKSRECYKNMSQEEKDKIKESKIYIYIYIYIYIKNWFNIKKMC